MIDAQLRAEGEREIWYRVIGPDGELWVETRDAAEAVRAAQEQDDWVLQRQARSVVYGPWKDWKPEEVA